MKIDSDLYMFVHVQQVKTANRNYSTCLLCQAWILHDSEQTISWWKTNYSSMVGGRIVGDVGMVTYREGFYIHNHN